MTFTVDIHHHMLPDFFWRATNEGDHPVGGIAPPPWSRASMLSFLDDAGIDVAVTSISTPGVHTGDDAGARALAWRCNELAAELTRGRPDRFGSFACLPLPDVDGALAELAYALDDLRLDGVVLFSNARGIYLGDPRFTPLFDELQRRRAVVFVLPNPSPDPSAHALGLPDSLIDFTADTTRAIAKLHYSNTFARTPDVRYVFAHAGGTVPYLAGRFGIVDEMRVIPGAETCATAAETFRRLYWDTALSWSDPVLRMLRDVVGIDHVLFGSDYPYLRRDLTSSTPSPTSRPMRPPEQDEDAMASTEKARRNHDELFPDRISTLAQTDPELIEQFDNFAFDEVLADSDLEIRTRLMVQLASLIACQAVSEFRVIAGAGLTIGLTPVYDVVYEADQHLPRRRPGCRAGPGCAGSGRFPG